MERNHKSTLQSLSIRASLYWKDPRNTDIKQSWMEKAQREMAENEGENGNEVKIKNTFC